MQIDDERLALRAGKCRCRTSEPAQIVYGTKAIDCVLSSVSPGDAEVCLRSLIDVPDLVTLRLPGGEMRHMRCCWQNGLHVGLLAVGMAPSAS